MADLDPRLIRMLARHFAYLQGLRLIVVAAFLQSVAQVWLATHSELWTMAGGPAAFLLYVALLNVPHLYYARFGRVAYPEAGDLAWMAPRMWAFSSALVLTGLLDHRLFVGAMRQTRVAAREAS